MSQTRRCILGVFAHPDDETTGCGGTFARYVSEGVEVHVATATRGEQGTLGTGGLRIEREDLPAVREAELRSVLELFGTEPPIFLGYRDQELMNANFPELVESVASVMRRVAPDVVITWGPTGVSRHDDHIAMHRATVEAFRRYVAGADVQPRLYYIAISEELAEQFELDVDESETSPTVVVDIREHKAVKLQALRLYRSQEDAQELAEMFESKAFDSESFHQAEPPISQDGTASGFWE